MRAVRRGAGNTAAMLLVPGAVLVAAALVALRLHFEPPTVPAYAIVGAADEIVLTRGGQFEVELRPTSPVVGAIGARAFLLRGEEVRPWDPPFAVTIQGSVRIEGAVETLFAGVPNGRWDVAVAVGRPEVLPTAPRDVLRSRNAAPSQAGWHLVRATIRLEQ